MARVMAWADAVVAQRPARGVGFRGDRAVRSLVSARSWRSGSINAQPHATRPSEAPTQPKSLLRRLDSVWQRLQVSRRGSYSGGRMQILHRYTDTTPLWRVLLVLVGTPLPSLGFVLALHCLPLQPPALGWSANSTFWLTLALDFFVIAQSFIAQLKQVMPELPITVGQTLLVSTVVTLGSLFVLTFVAAVWVFPVPFGVVVYSPLFVLLLLLVVRAIVGAQARARMPQLRLKSRVYAHILAVQGLLVAIYPGYNAIFVQLTDVQQAIFVVMPALIKFGVKNLLFEACVPLPLNDELPEMMIFTADLFNAIYVTACMQSARASPLTALLIFGVGTVQLMLAVRTLLHRGRSLRSVLKQLPLDNRRMGSFHSSGSSMGRQSGAEQLAAVGVRMCFQNGHRSSVTRSAGTGIDGVKQIFAQAGPTHAAGDRKVAIVVPRQLKPQVVSTQARERLVQQILATLYTCEYLILSEYVKTVIPLVSTVHTIALYYLPAKQYYRVMDQYTSTEVLGQSVGKVSTFLALQLVAVAVLGLLLRRKLRHSILYHLAFVLEHNREMIQMRLLTWVTFAFLLPMDHVGADFSFQFSWIKK